LKVGLASLLVFCSALASASALPHYRLFTNILGGGASKGGAYFTQDDLYDAEIKPVLKNVAVLAKDNAQVATEIPTVCAYYAKAFNRPDLVCISLSDAAATRTLSEGDYVVAARGRHYFSNDAVLTALTNSSQPMFSVQLGKVKAADVYILDKSSAERIRGLAR
jgi:hypothetical protein